MATTEEAQAAARKFNGQEIDGRTLKVEFGRVARGARSAWYQSLLDSTRPCATTCSRGRPSTRVTSWLRSPIACLIGSATCSRRTFSARGPTSATLQALLGHSRLDTTEIYTQVANPELVKAIRRLRITGPDSGPPPFVDSLVQSK